MAAKQSKKQQIAKAPAPKAEVKAAGLSIVPLLAGEACDGESSEAIVSCNDYVRMGPGRSIRDLHVIYLRKHREGIEAAANNEIKELPPTRRLRCLLGWSARYGWVRRAALFDGANEEAKEAARLQEQQDGLAQDFERIRTLKQVAELLLAELFEEDEDGTLRNLWVKDVKSIGSGEFATQVDLEKYNSAIVSDLRGILDDLAKETGGRKSISEVSGRNGKPIEVKHSGGDDLSHLTTDELLNIRDILAVAEARTDEASG